MRNPQYETLGYAFLPYPMSSPRKRGPITDASSWVLAFAGMTAVCSGGYDV